MSGQKSVYGRLNSLNFFPPPYSPYAMRGCYGMPRSAFASSVTVSTTETRAAEGPTGLVLWCVTYIMGDLRAACSVLFALMSTDYQPCKQT